jgi:hypothetical protein
VAWSRPSSSTGQLLEAPGLMLLPTSAEAVTENTPFVWSGHQQVEVSKRAHVVKAVLYAVQTLYAFMIM